MNQTVIRRLLERDGHTVTLANDGLASTRGTITGKNPWRYSGDHIGGHQQEHHDLFAALRRGEIPNEGDYGAKSTMTSIFGRMATYSGKAVTWRSMSVGVAAVILVPLTDVPFDEPRSRISKLPSEAISGSHIEAGLKCW